MNRRRTHVLIAGGGVAALEAAIALRELAADSVDIELLSPDEYFAYRPQAVTLPFGETEAMRFPLSQLADAVGATVTRGALTGIDAWRHVAHTSTNRDVGYDVLLVACGALPLPSIEGALTFRGPSDADLVRHVLDEVARDEIRSVAFVVPWGPAWPLPAYELALLAGSHLGRRGELWVVTPEKEPLQLFGGPASVAVRELLEARNVRLRTDAYAERFVDGRLELVPDEPLDVDRVIALPRLAGTSIDGIPQTIEGFIPVDDHGRVHGVADVYAAGDATSFPVKHGGLATQQALAAAEMIAAKSGADVDPQPFRPVVHGLLLTGSEPRFFRRELHGTAENEPVAASEALWWPPAKIAGRHLGPFLATLVGHPEPHVEPPDDALAVHVPLEHDLLEELDLGRFPTADDAPDGEPELSAVSAMDVSEVAPEDTLGEIAERMLRDDLSAALVCEHGRLIGILTTHDLIGAFAARAHPSVARARQWMTAEPIVLDPPWNRASAARLMRAYGIRHLPLVEHGDRRPVGMLYLEEEAPAVMPVGLGF
jgi:sulfide:quinone oxidoreductase